MLHFKYTLHLFGFEIHTATNMQFITVLLTVFMSAGGLSLPTTASNSTIDQRSLAIANGWIGMYPNDKCRGDARRYGWSPNISHKNRCIPWIHNNKQHSRYPFVKVNFGRGAVYVPEVRIFKDNDCKDFIGVLKHPKKGIDLCVEPRVLAPGNTDWGSIMSVQSDED